MNLPVVLLHAGHDVILVIHTVIAVLVLAPVLQGKRHQRQPLASANQLEVACVARVPLNSHISMSMVIAISVISTKACAV